MSDFSDSSLASTIWNYYNESKMDKRNLYAQWEACMRIVRARHPNPNGGSSRIVFDPEIYPMISMFISYIMDQGIDIEASPIISADDPNYEKLSSLADDLQTLLSGLWHGDNWSIPLEQSLWDAAIFGSGILKVGWNTTKAEGLGDVELQRISPFAVYQDPDAKDEYDAAYIIERKELSYDEIRRRYPDVSERLIAKVTNMSSSETTEPKLTSSRTPFTTSAVNATGQPAAFGKMNPGDLSPYDRPHVVVYECWLKEVHEKTIPASEFATPMNGDDDVDDFQSSYDRWRIVVMAAGEILLDEFADELYGINTHPYRRVAFEMIPDFWPTSLALYCFDAQNAINRLLYAVQLNAELAGNPIWLEPDNAGTARTPAYNRPGQRLTYSAASNGGPTWMQPPPVPDYVMGLIQFWIGRIENTAGLSGAAKGATPAPRTPTGSTQQAQETAVVRVRNAIRHVEVALKELLGIASQLISENYVSSRIVSIAGQQSQQSALQLQARHFYVIDSESADIAPMKFSIQLSAGGDSPTSRAARVAEIQTLRALGVVDNQAVMEIIKLKDWRNILTRMQQQQILMGEAKEVGARAGTGRMP